MNIQWLLDKMAGWANEPAIINSHETITYGDILNHMEAVYDDTFDSTLVLQNISLHTVAMILILANENISIPITTSGTTGEPKITYHNIADLIAPFKDKHLTKSRMIMYLMPNHIGGLNTILRSLVSGGALILPDDRSVDGVCKAIEEYKADLLPTTPSFLNMLVLSRAYQAYDLYSLKVISFGTEVMPETLMKRLMEIFPKIKWVQTYGTTELGIPRTITHSTNPLYIHFPERVTIDNGTLWIDGKDTGDMVETIWEDEKTWVRVLGRQSDIINVGGVKVHPQEVEEVVAQMQGVEDVVCYGESNAIMGNIVVAKIKLKDGFGEEKNWVERVRHFCTEKGMDKHTIPMKVIVTSESLVNERGKKVRK